MARRAYTAAIFPSHNHLSAPQYEQVLSEAHAKYVVGISATLERRDGHQIFVGSMKKKQQAEVMSKLDSTQFIVATGRFVGEGFDLPRLDTLILALPVSWKGSLIQYVGRIQRDYKGKEEVKVIDYVDAKIPMLLRMFNKREKGYRALGFLSESIIQEQLI
ncbi:MULTISPECIES: helicase-related protein [unclassified Vibrio]|uniref:DEAD/DEAH box helicase n=1 Tax=unclassified Vibrio TaxID=2614977 RepID=UPI002350A1DA|nr:MULTISPECIES: helicase-related protein [unclassified Vibrio]